MKKFLALACCTLLAFAAAAAEIEISNLRSIYIADRTATPAAKELALYLHKVFGKNFAVRRAAKADKPGFYIGKAFAPKDIKVEHREQIFQKIDADGKIFLWAAENSRTIPGDSRAVTTFLENVCGIRWLWPTASGEVIPKSKSIKVKVGLSSEKPAFPIRILKYGIERNWGRRMKLGESMKYVTGHAFNKLIHPDKYFKTNPEYFALVSANNWIGSGNKPAVAARSPLQLCTSNPDVRRIIAEKVAASKDGIMQSISPNDGYGFCECANCRAQDAEQWTSIYKGANLSDRMYDFTRDVAIQAKKLNPKSKVLLNGYSFYEKPPKKLYKMPDNVYVLRCLFGTVILDRKELAAEFDYYKKAGIGLFLYEYWGTYNQGMPWNVVHTVDWETKLLKSVNGLGMRVENASEFASAGLTNYVGSKMLWNPDLDVDAVIDDYCRKGFGKGASAMKEYYSLVEEYTTRVFKNARGGYVMTLRGLGMTFDETFFKKGDQLFAKALKSGVTPAERTRILYVKSGFDYGKTIAAWSRILSEVNAHGGSLPLVLPTSSEPAEINDELLKKLYATANKICETRHRQSLAGAMKRDHSITYNPRLDRTLHHMPYQFMIQHLQKGAIIGFTNYFVNNAFELRNPPGFKRQFYGWFVNGGKFETILTDCHDDIYDITAMYHAKQGNALAITLKPGEKATVTSAVKVVLASGTRMMVSGWFKNGIPQAAVNFDVDGKKSVKVLPLAATGLKEKSNWQELTFTPFVYPQGKKVSATITFTVRNDGKTEQKILFDDLKFNRAK